MYEEENKEMNLEKICMDIDQVVKELEPEIKLIAFEAYAAGWKETTGEDLPIPVELKIPVARSRDLDELQKWMVERGFDSGVRNCSLLDDDDKCVGTVNIGWPYGIYGERGYTKPVAVQFYDSTPELLETAKICGFEVFESIEEFKAFLVKYCKA